MVRDRGCWGGRRREDRTEGVGEVGILETITQCQRLRRQDLLTGRDDRGHFAEHEPEHSVGRTEREINSPGGERLLEHAGKGLGEFGVADRVGRRPVQRSGGIVVFDGQPEDSDDVVDVDPAHPLIALGHESAAAADRSARAELEDRGHDLERAGLRGQHDPGPDDGPADAERSIERETSSHSRQTTARKSVPDGLDSVSSSSPWGP